ncbi:MAG: IS982 family transposase [Cyanobacteria bacterium P01_F01_bin.33]
MELEQLFWDIDDFCQSFEPDWRCLQLPETPAKRQRPPRLNLSEVMTVVIHFHASNYRTFKHYYIEHVAIYLRSAFPHLVSYNRFVELMSGAMLPLLVYLSRRKGEVTGINYIDSTPIAVCHPRRANRHQVFETLAQWGKNSFGWYFGFKLHLVINERGALLGFQLTPANPDARKPVPELVKGLSGKVFGDKGYISQALFEKLFSQGLQLVTPLKKNMHNRLLPIMDKLLLRKRSLIETVNDQLKNISQIAHSRHRSPINFLVNLIAGLIAYTYQEKKPSLNLDPTLLAQLPAAAVI